MARFLSLITRKRCFWLGAGVLLNAVVCGSLLQAAPATTNVAPVFPNPPGAASPALGTNKPAAIPPPPLIQDTFNRYGKIWAPSDDVSHPLKLNINVQFPGVGEMQIPSQDELNIRVTLEQLAILSDADIRAKLEQWPPYTKMNLRDEGQLLTRIQQFKEQRNKIAMDKARDLGLLNSLTPDQKARFEKDYWDKRLQMDRELSKQFEPILKAKEQKMYEALFREFSPPGAGGPPAPKTPPSPVAQMKPAMPPPSSAPSMGGPSPTPPVGQNMAH